MARKSKQPGGHNPLTAHEVKRLKSSGYGTQTTRLSTTASHLPFGHCCLSLSPIIEGGGAVVATPSGHVYSREAIVQYLLTKTRELRQRKTEYDRLRLHVENKHALYQEKLHSLKQAAFITKDQGAMNNGNSSVALVSRDFGRKQQQQQHGTALALVVASDTTSATTTATTTTTTYTPKSKRVENSLSHVSYWLASSQPSRATATTNKNKVGGDDVNDMTTEDFDYLREIETLPPIPPNRPNSPMSGEPLRLKQLIPLHLLYEGDDDVSSYEHDKKSKRGSVICSVSHKVITTQPIIALHGHVMLKDMYTQYALPTLICPITGRKFNVKKDVIELVAGRSGYAASGGTVVAKKYNPTLT